MLLWDLEKVMDTERGVHDSMFTSLPGAVQCQLVERAAAVVVTSGAAVAAVDGDSDEFVPVQNQAFVRERAVGIGAGCCVRCAEGVQDLEATVFPEAVNYPVAIRASGLGVRVESPMWPES